MWEVGPLRGVPDGPLIGLCLVSAMEFQGREWMLELPGCTLRGFLWIETLLNIWKMVHDLIFWRPIFSSIQRCGICFRKCVIFVLSHFFQAMASWVAFLHGIGRQGGGVFPPCDDDDFSRLSREKVGAFKIQLGDEVLEVIIFLYYSTIHILCRFSMSRFVVGFGNVFMDICGYARMPTPFP